MGKRTRKHDGTACMVHAWFGAIGCGPAIARFYGPDKKPKVQKRQDRSPKTATVTDGGDHG